MPKRSGSVRSIFMRGAFRRDAFQHVAQAPHGADQLRLEAFIDLAAQGDVTISALDARGVYVTEANASDDARGRSPGVIGSLRNGAMTHTESVMGELADGTGGSYFRHSNDLDAGFKSLTDAPESVYLLELSLADVKPNGSYHRLKVKVNRDGVQLQVRHGYFVPKAQKGKK